jgi:hypothetical protein
MPIIPLNRIASVDINVEREVDKLAAYRGPKSLEGAALQQVYITFNNMKTLKFFRLVYERYGNRETENARNLRTHDMFEADLGKGKLYIIVDISSEALNAFLDDGSVAFKMREWITESCRRVVDTSLGWKPIQKWDRYFYGIDINGTAFPERSVLPRGVKIIPFFKEEFTPGVPALLLLFVKH